MEKLYIDKWFKLPPKADEKLLNIKILPKDYGRRKAENAKLRKKTKKQTSKKSG